MVRIFSLLAIGGGVLALSDALAAVNSLNLKLRLQRMNGGFSLNKQDIDLLLRFLEGNQGPHWSWEKNQIFLSGGKTHGESGSDITSSNNEAIDFLRAVKDNDKFANFSSLSSSTWMKIVAALEKEMALVVQPDLHSGDSSGEGASSDDDGASHNGLASGYRVKLENLISKIRAGFEKVKAQKQNVPRSAFSHPDPEDTQDIMGFHLDPPVPKMISRVQRMKSRANEYPKLTGIKWVPDHDPLKPVNISISVDVSAFSEAIKVANEALHQRIVLDGKYLVTNLEETFDNLNNELNLSELQSIWVSLTKGRKQTALKVLTDENGLKNNIVSNGYNWHIKNLPEGQEHRSTKEQKEMMIACLIKAFSKSVTKLY